MAGRSSVTTLAAADAALSVRLRDRVEEDPRYWDFRQLRERSGSHGLFQYPAMMVPELQGALLDDVMAVDAAVSSVYDPFCGSGTVLVESVTRGLDFIGGDVNPMALLLSSVKGDPPSVSEARRAYRRVLFLAGQAEPGAPRDFFGRDKWFTPDVLTHLQLLQAAIRSINPRRVRRFLWVCLAETIRLTSNSRISTFKLHIYAEDVLKSREVNAMSTFKAVAERNARGLFDYWAQVTAEGLKLGRSTLLPGAAAQSWQGDVAAPDVLMTSPPYGDNRTTVPYGQHSYLPLQWIGGRDIEGGIDPALLSTTASIDAVSLGGSNKGVLERRDELVAVSDGLRDFLDQITGRDTLLKKVLSFTGDYYDTLQAVSARLRPGAYCFFTLGERRVGKQLFPLVAITAELLESVDHVRVHEFHRNLPLGRKRMAVSNSEGATMASETVLVTRRRTANE